MAASASLAADAAAVSTQLVSRNADGACRLGTVCIESRPDIGRPSSRLFFSVFFQGAPYVSGFRVGAAAEERDIQLWWRYLAKWAPSHQARKSACPEPAAARHAVPPMPFTQGLLSSPSDRDTGAGEDATMPRDGRPIMLCAERPWARLPSPLPRKPSPPHSLLSRYPAIIVS